MNLLNLNSLEQILQTLKLNLPIYGNWATLGAPLRLAGRTLRNRIVVQPMEGCDGEANGAPGELTRRRYLRFGESGAALIWFEATAVVEEGRANPRQLMLTEETLPAFERLVEMLRAVARQETGFEPVLILQATHSGRYSKPKGAPAPMIACHNPIYEKNRALGDERIVSDGYLDARPEAYAQTARLAQKAGFDGVDVKACHRYLVNELLSAYTRPGRYGGSFENRTRLYTRAIEAARAATTGDFWVVSRLNVYDALPRPYGFGADAQENFDPEEPIRLVRLLADRYAMPLLDVTIGNPYFNPHVNRPFDQGAYEPPEHPLEGVARMCRCTAAIKKAVPEIAVVSSGNSYLRALSPCVAAGMIESGMADLAGFGREAFAYPTFPRDVLEKGWMDPGKCCLTCSKCTELMRAGGTAGCVLRDGEVYAPLYKKYVLESKEDIRHKVSAD